jgi:AraC-like DNA-binding protein
MDTQIRLSAGDFVVLPRGDQHFLRDAPSTPTIDFFDLIKEQIPGRNGTFRAGGRGAVTKMLCGGMQFENGATDPLLAVLPPLIHIKHFGDRAAPWLKSAIAQILEELDSDRTGSEAIVTRLADILFTQAVRAYLEENVETAKTGWLAALRDKQIGGAIALLHAEPRYPWTVDALADRFALSRSAFAERFSRLVREPPLRYLTRVRLSVASERLRSTEDKLRAVATFAGYESAAAFSKAFKRYMGITPGEYRRRHSVIFRVDVGSEVERPRGVLGAVSKVRSGSRP